MDIFLSLDDHDLACDANRILYGLQEDVTILKQKLALAQWRLKKFCEDNKDLLATYTGMETLPPGEFSRLLKDAQELLKQQ